MIRTVACLGVALVLVAPANSEDAKAKAFDPAKLVGVWNITAGERGGDKVDKDRLQAKITITKDTITIPAGDQKFVIGYKIDPKADPASIDMVIKEGPGADGQALGIVAWGDDGFKLCYVTKEGPETKRPKKFESTKDNNAFLFHLKPVKK
jgi:uncharacterized protein (TIGR03067 family)